MPFGKLRACPFDRLRAGPEPVEGASARPYSAAAIRLRCEGGCDGGDAGVVIVAAVAATA